MGNISMKNVFLILTLLALWCVHGECCPLRNSNNDLRIAAFNIQNLGPQKMKDTPTVDIIVQIMKQYDIILIQEIVDKTGQTPGQLLQALNKVASTDPFRTEVSGRLGPGKRKEQYAYYYRPSKVTVTATFQWPDPNNVFSRPPYCVRFSAPNFNIKDFGFIGIHTPPTNAVAEINGLTDVYDDVINRWKLDNIIIGGDYNAAPPYVGKKDWKNISLFTDARFQWIISNNDDTTVGGGGKALDRFVLGGNQLKQAYAQGERAKPYDFKSDMQLSDYQAKKVSDHRPIQFGIA